MSALWKKVKLSIRTISHIANDAPAHKYTARASYSFQDRQQGLCVDIDRLNTVGMRLFGMRPLGKVLQCFLVFMTYTLVMSSLTLIFSPATTTVRKVSCVTIGICSALLPLVFILDANWNLLKRIMFKTFVPYVKLYFVTIEVLCLCDMCGWSWRAAAVAPLLWSSQLLLFVSDAVFFRKPQRTCVYALLLLFVAWRIVLLCGARFAWFGSVKYHVFTIWGVSFMNSGTLISKMFGMILFMIGQIIFKFRRPANLYSVRTTYTILENCEWNRLERDKRVLRKSSHLAEVEKAKDILGI